MHTFWIDSLFFPKVYPHLLNEKPYHYMFGSFRCAVLLQDFDKLWFANFDIHVLILLNFGAHAEFASLNLVLLRLALDVFCLSVYWYLCNGCTCFLGEWGSLAPSRCQGNTGRWTLDWSPPWQHGHCPENDGYCYSHSSDLQIQGQGHKYYWYVIYCGFINIQKHQFSRM